MRTVMRRVRRLEEHFTPAQPDYLRNPNKRFRLVVSDMDRDLRLETSTCNRYVTENGCLMEIVRLDGIRKGLSDAEWEQFVSSFPIRWAKA